MSKYIAKYILRKEYLCPCCKSFPPDFDLENVLKGYEKLFESFKDIREKWGKAIPVTSGYRCIKRQMELYNQGISSTPYSAHVWGLALDLDCVDEDEVLRLKDVILRLHPQLRVGYKLYLLRGQSFLHIDCGYFIHPRFSEKLRERTRW